MAWQRSGDTGATYPPLMAVRGDRRSDDRTINEVAGFLWRLSMQSGAHLTDYVVDVGTVEMLGPATRASELVRLCVKQGLLTKVPGGYRIVQDPDFIHLRLRAEVERERQQRGDTADLALTVPVRRRDGDHCRWCGIGVVWPGRKTKRSAELDHLHPDKLDAGIPTTVDDLVIACRGCNRTRAGNRAEWDSAHTLRPVPVRPFYTGWTADFLTENGYPTQPSSDSARPAPAPGADPAPDGVRPATGLSDDPAAPAPELGLDLPPTGTGEGRSSPARRRGRRGRGTRPRGEI